MRAIPLAYSLTFICLILLPCVLLGQSFEITGSVYSESEKGPAPFANVVLRSSVDSNLVLGTVADDAGAFLLKSEAGNFLVEFRLLEHKSKFVPVEVSGDLQMGPINLLPAVTEINNFTVTARRPTIKKDKGEITFITENTSISNAGSSA